MSLIFYIRFHLFWGRGGLASATMVDTDLVVTTPTSIQTLHPSLIFSLTHGHKLGWDPSGECQHTRNNEKTIWKDLASKLSTHPYKIGVCVCVQSRLTLCDPVDCSLPGFSVHGIFQARILEWVAISSSRGSSWPRHHTWVSSISCTGRRIPYQLATWEVP